VRVRACASVCMGSTDAGEDGRSASVPRSILEFNRQVCRVRVCVCTGNYHTGGVRVCVRVVEQRACDL
jgi:hypothetical protein